MFSQTIIVGHLGRDPEMRYTSTGVPVTSFSIAVSRRWTGQDGQQQEKTTWYRVSAWRKLAEFANQYLTKGSRVLVVGELDEARIYNAPDGTARVSLDVTAQQIRFMSAKGETGSGSYGDTDVQPVDRGYGGGGYSSGGGNGNAGGGGSGAPSQSDDDIPF